MGRVWGEEISVKQVETAVKQMENRWITGG